MPKNNLLASLYNWHISIQSRKQIKYRGRPIFLIITIILYFFCLSSFIACPPAHACRSYA